MFSIFLILCLSHIVLSHNSCLKLDISVTQKVENEGFHR